jgi:hypothetical protein
MALGGGIFTSQTKVLPGSYINIVSTSSNQSNVGERGVVALPMILKWGDSGEVITVTADEFQRESLSLFGYAYDAPELLELREIFKHAQKVHVYNLSDKSPVKSSCKYATAKKEGSRGDQLKLVIQSNVDNESLFDVTLYFGSTIVHEQTVANIAALKDNDFVDWTDVELAVEAGVNFTGGSDGTTDNNSYQNALNAFENYKFNILVTPNADAIDLFVAYTKRMRDERGIKFQTVIPAVKSSNYEAVIEVPEDQPVTMWVAGALAGCAVNKSCTNMKYDGEKTIPVNRTQMELEDCVRDGIFVFHKVENEVRVLMDINSLTTFTDEKNEMFSSNQVIRVIDQCANDTARIFNNKYLGKVQNDQAGRVSLWNEIVTHRRELEQIRAIDAYNSETLIVSAGSHKNSVVVSEVIIPVSSMEKLYMTIVIN